MAKEGANLSAAEMDEALRFGIHDDDEVTISVSLFQMENRLTDAELGALLREFRSETGWSAFELGELDMLSDDFRNWFKWERL